MSNHNIPPSLPTDQSQDLEIKSRKEAAEYLHLSLRSFDRLVAAHHIPHVMIGKRRKFLLRDLNAYVYERRGV